MASVKIGFLLWPQTASWPELRDAAALADRSGAASLWTWDHLNSIVGPSEGPIFEGWTTLAGWSQVTERATLGLMVAANTFRNPGLTAKLATTLDHLSGGRAVLGLGGAWFEREHDGFGIDFGSGFGERLDRLDEAVMLVRRLLDGETVTHDGPVYPMREAICAPPPVQVRLPIMIGGSGPQEDAQDGGHVRATSGTSMGELAKLTERDAILREHCAAVGRDESAIERTTTVDIVIRDTHEAGARRTTRPGSRPTARSSIRTGTSSSGRRRRSPRRCSRSSSSGSATSSSTCRRRTTRRRSGGSASSSSC